MILQMNKLGMLKFKSMCVLTYCNESNHSFAVTFNSILTFFSFSFCALIFFLKFSLSQKNWGRDENCRDDVKNSDAFFSVVSEVFKCLLRDCNAHQIVSVVCKCVSIVYVVCKLGRGQSNSIKNQEIETNSCMN